MTWFTLFIMIAIISSISIFLDRRFVRNRAK